MAVHRLLYQYKSVLVGSMKYTVHHFSSSFRGKIYYCMTGRAIRVNISSRYTEVENGIFPRIARPEDLQ